VGQVEEDPLACAALERPQAHGDFGTHGLPGEFALELGGVGDLPGDGLAMDDLGASRAHGDADSRSRRSRAISRCSSPIPEMMFWPVSGSARTANVGSSPASLASACESLSESALLRGSTASAMTGFEKRIGSSQQRVRGTRQGVAGGGGLETGGRDDVSGDRLVEPLALVGVHPEDPGELLLTAARRVEQCFAGADPAGVDPEVGQPAVLSGHDLERQRAERRADPRLAQLVPAGARVGAFDGRHIGRGGQQVDDRVEQGLETLVAQCAAAEHRRHRAGDRQAPKGCEEIDGRRVRLLEVCREKTFVALGQHFDQPAPRLRGAFGQLAGDLGDLVVRAEVLLVPEQGPHADQVDHAAEILLAADRQLQGHGGRAQLVGNGAQHGVEVGPDPVELVDEADDRHPPALGLVPYGSVWAAPRRHRRRPPRRRRARAASVRPRS